MANKRLIDLIFLDRVNTIISLLALVPLMIFNIPTIVSFGPFSIQYDVIFFFYFLLEFIIRYKERKLHGIFIVFDILTLLSFVQPFSVFRILKLSRLFSVAIRFSGIRLLISIIRENVFLFQSMLYISLIYMFVTSVLVFNIEPQTFDYNYFLAFYWSGITLTTVGFGDIYPVTHLGQLISLISSFLGVGIIALPTGVISTNFILKVQAYEQNHHQKPAVPLFKKQAQDSGYQQGDDTYDE